MSIKVIDADDMVNHWEVEVLKECESLHYEMFGDLNFHPSRMITHLEYIHTRSQGEYGHIQPLLSDDATDNKFRMYINIGLVKTKEYLFRVILHELAHTVKSDGNNILHHNEHDFERICNYYLNKYNINIKDMIDYDENSKQGWISLL